MTSKTITGRYAIDQAEKLLQKLNRQIARTIQTPGADETHDLRVAIRRFTRVLIALKPCFPRQESRQLRRELKKIMEEAGKVRDRDIAVRLLEKISPTGPDAAAPETRQEREDSAQSLNRLLRRWVRLHLASEWRAARKPDSDHKRDRKFSAAAIGVTAAQVLPPVVDRFFRRGEDAARDGASAPVIHRFRIAAKNLRYTLDLFAPVFMDVQLLDGRPLDSPPPISIAGLSDQLKDIQDLLGDINDAATVRRLLAETAGKKILSALGERESKKTSQFREHYGALLSDARMRRQWKNTVRNTATGALLKSSRHKTATGKHRPV